MDIGHWIPIDPDVGMITDTFECSHCGQYVTMPIYEEWCEYQFCPYCGCHMEDVDDGR